MCMCLPFAPPHYCRLVDEVGRKGPSEAGRRPPPRPFESSQSVAPLHSEGEGPRTLRKGKEAFAGSFADSAIKKRVAVALKREAETIFFVSPGFLVSR